MTQKLEQNGEIQNNTDTELKILQSIEKAFYEKNPNARKRNTERSMKWFSRYVPKAHNKVRLARIARDRSLFKKGISIGSLYTFEYDAKTKDELPVWDANPLVFFFDEYTAKDGSKMLLGINMHYLKPELRLVAFKALLKLRNQKRYRKNTRLQISWGVLKTLGSSKLFEHSVKQYRVDHLRSQFVKIPPKSWELIMWLPLARWQKGGAKTAYKM